MNRIRAGVLLIALSTLVAVAGGVLVALGEGWLAVAAFVVAEAFFWLGVLLLGHSTYKVARAKGLRQVPAELWRLFRSPAATGPGTIIDRH